MFLTLFLSVCFSHLFFFYLDTDLYLFLHVVDIRALNHWHSANWGDWPSGRKHPSQMEVPYEDQSEEGAVSGCLVKSDVRNEAGGVSVAGRDGEGDARSEHESRSCRQIHLTRHFSHAHCTRQPILMPSMMSGRAFVPRCFFVLTLSVCLSFTLLFTSHFYLYSDLNSFFHVDSAKAIVPCASADWGVLLSGRIHSSHRSIVLVVVCVSSKRRERTVTSSSLWRASGTPRKARMFNGSAGKAALGTDLSGPTRCALKGKVFGLGHSAVDAYRVRISWDLGWREEHGVTSRCAHLGRFVNVPLLRLVGSQDQLYKLEKFDWSVSRPT